MMVRFSVRCIALLVSTSMILTLGCGDSSRVGVNGENRIDYNDYTPPDTVADGRIQHVEPCDAASTTCARTLSVGDSLELRARLVDKNGEPVRNALLVFEEEILSGAEGVSLDARRAATDSNGIAALSLRTRDNNPAANMGSVRVEVSAEGAEIAPITFTIGITTKEGGAYVIHYDHQGQATPTRVHTFLLRPDISCDEAIGEFFTTRFWPPAEVQLPPATVYPNGDIAQVIYPQVSNTEAFTVLGVARQNIGAQSVDVAYGCADGNDAVDMGQDVHVYVDLIDHIPHLGGTYDVTHRFDLTSGLPPAVSSVVQLIETLVNNPAAFILGCPDTQSVCGDGQFGLLDLIFDLGFLPDSLVASVEAFRDGSFYPIAMDFLNDLLYGDPNVAGDTGILPSWAHSGVIAAGDITAMLQSFTVQGRMQFAAQPDIGFEDGQVIGILYEENNRQIWDSLIFQWSQGCQGMGPSCSQVVVSTNNIGASTTNTVSGNFAATIQGAASLHIERHPLTLHYGELILAIIEKVILPRLFGPEVNSLDALLDGDTVNGVKGPGLIDCPALANLAASEGSLFHDAVIDLCTALRTQAVNAVREYIASTLVADGDEHFRLGTPENEPCTIYQRANYVGNNWPGSPLPLIETLGKEEPALRCKWEAEIRLSSNASATVVDGTFDGKLLD